LKALDLLPRDPVKRVDAMLGLADALGRAGATKRGGAVCLEAADAARALGDGARLCAAALAYGAEVTQLRHSRALEILEQIVACPGREFHVLDLAARGDPNDLIDVGDAGEALDDKAKASYRKRIGELDEELAEAEHWADSARRERLQAEAEFLRQELARALGTAGRDRRAARAAERARVNVQKRLRGAIQRIGEALPDLERHLQDSVTTGLYVSYRP
jgi:hypothetical protein